MKEALHITKEIKDEQLVAYSADDEGNDGSRWNRVNSKEVHETNPNAEQPRDPASRVEAGPRAAPLAAVEQVLDQHRAADRTAPPDLEGLHRPRGCRARPATDLRDPELLCELQAVCGGLPLGGHHL